MRPPSHGLVVLAAGSSRRLGVSKQLLEAHNETLVHRAARLGIATQPADAVVVVSPGAADLSPTLADLPVRVVVCANAISGMGASLRSGCLALSPECLAALVLQVDQWKLDDAHLLELLQVWRESPEAPVASAYGGVIGVPALLPRNWFANLPENGDFGARALLRAATGRVRSVAAPDLAQDLDDPADLAEWQVATGQP
ncbi:MAG: nucleotidyltransferase family protein [Tahibacter sp.]